MHIEPASRRSESIIVSEDWAVARMLISGSPPAERAKCAPCILASPRPAIVSKGEPSVRTVPERSIREPTIPSRSSPPQRAPKPVDDMVDAPASKMPCTSMIASDEMRNSTPSFTVIFVDGAMVKSPSRR